MRARAFAQATGQVVYTWSKALSGTFINQFESNRVNEIIKTMAQENLALLNVFVAGAPAFLLQNVFPQARLANGSYVELHSLTFQSQAAAQDMIEQATIAKPGETIMLTECPQYVNVIVKNLSADQIRQWPQGEKLSQFPNEVVVPIGLLSSDQKKTVQVLAHQDMYGDGEVETRMHAVEVGFGVTYHKVRCLNNACGVIFSPPLQVQGKTINKVIIDLGGEDISYSALLVALSRVRCADDMRILPLAPGKTLRYILVLFFTLNS